MRGPLACMPSSLNTSTLPVALLSAISSSWLTIWRLAPARFGTGSSTLRQNAPWSESQSLGGFAPHEVWKGYDNAKEYAAFVTKTLVNKDGDIKRRIMSMFSPEERPDDRE